MKRLLLGLVAAGLVFAGSSAVRAADWDGDGWDDGVAVAYVVPRPVYVIPAYRAPLYAPIVRRPVATAVRIATPPLRVVPRVAPVRRATRIVGRRVLLR